MKHSIILIYFELNIWPFATAPGSDRPSDSFIYFLCKAQKEKTVYCLPPTPLFPFSFRKNQRTGS